MTETNSNNSPAATERRPPGKSQWKLAVPCLAIGLVVGAAATALAVWKTMPHVMLTVHRGQYADVERTCRELKAAAEANGWSVPAIRNMNRSMAKHGGQFDRPVRIVDLCHADYAREVLAVNPEVSTLMPCALGVYEGPDGGVYISGMNIGLMGRMFGGTIAEVMGEKVAADEHRILQSVVEP